MKKVRGWGIFALLSIAVILGGCRSAQKDANAVPEVEHRDWRRLRSLVSDYERSRGEMEARQILIVQNDFRALTEFHSNDRIGDEALYFVGRIYYDLRAYHDARKVFLHHRDLFPNSEFAPTITRLEAQMDKELADYANWLEQSRLGTATD